MSALKCVVLSPDLFEVILIVFISEVSHIQIAWYMLTAFVGAGFLKKLSMNAKFVDSGGQEKVTFSQVLSFSVSIL